MKITWILMLNLLLLNLNAQEFSFSIYFRDAENFKDTVTIGFDDLATYGIDSDFGEENIINTPYKPGLDVRVGDIWSNRFDGQIGELQLKKQILGPDPFEDIISIDVKTRNFPVTAKWDKSLFQDEYFSTALLTSIPPGGWWDVGSPSDLFRIYFQETDSVTFTSNVYDIYPNDYSYIAPDQDTVSVFYFSFFIIDGVGNRNVVNKEELEIFPNPFQRKLSLRNKGGLKIGRLQLIDINGAVVLNSAFEPEIQTDRLHSGVYFLIIELDDGTRLHSKVMKF